jgi:hypothetical protein
MTDRELMQMALDALKDAALCVQHNSCPPDGGNDWDEQIEALRERLAKPEQEPVAFRNINTGDFCTGGFLRKDWAKWQPLYAAPVHASENAEKQEPVGYLYDWLNPENRDEVIRDWFAASMYVIEKDKGFNVRPLYTAPVHASDMSQERVDETAKDRHEFEEMVKKGTKAWADTPDNWVDDLRGGDQPLYAKRVYARPVVHAVRCTYPQCQATNGCVGACSKTAPLKREWVGLTAKDLAEIPSSCYEGAIWADAKLKEKNHG